MLQLVLKPTHWELHQAYIHLVAWARVNSHEEGFLRLSMCVF